MPSTKISLWSNAPFIRLVLPLISGILFQWHLQFSLPVLVAFILLFVALALVFHFLPVHRKFQFSAVNGISMCLLIAALGALLVWMNDIRNKENWVGHHYSKSDWVTVSLTEPLVEKERSYKALGNLASIVRNDSGKSVTGQVLIYFKKDSAIDKIAGYGSQLVFKKPLQPIQNSGNPGSFDYKQYSLFQGTTHQVYLTAGDFIVLPDKKQQWLKRLIIQSRHAVVNTLRRYIGGRKEEGLAEALLIGYKDDLDKSLVQSYSNTGVVHIIAISGLHLGLIYWLLLLLTRRIKGIKRLAWLRFLIIVTSLWMFSLMAGAQPSVLRSALMFSCLALGEVINRRTSVYNTLAMSAFILLCWNPFWLWDVGFQLSYAAVLSIFIFYKPIYNLLYIPNKALDYLWKLIAVTLAAQLLTFPISLYHFHQFPVLFLFTNFVAVPLSSLILLGEILLCCVSFITPVATAIGFVVEVLIQWMNAYVERLDSVSFAVWNGFSVSIVQTILLMGIIAGLSLWLLEKVKAAVWLSLSCVLAFVVLRSFSFYEANEQKKLIVYNVPHHQAIDVLQGRTYCFIGDAELVKDDFIRNFHLQPSRIVHRINPAPATPGKAFNFCQNKILIIDSTIRFIPSKNKAKIDVLILSKSPRLYLSQLVTAFTVKQIVMDGSIPAWKKKLWKKDCDSFHLPYHDVTEKGAFVMTAQ